MRCHRCSGNMCLRKGFIDGSTGDFICFECAGNIKHSKVIRMIDHKYVVGD